jgi:hypothetical protein
MKPTIGFIAVATKVRTWIKHKILIPKPSLTCPRLYKQKSGTSLIYNMVKTTNTDDTILYLPLFKASVLRPAITSYSLKPGIFQP